MGMKILHTCRSEICARFPFFSYASAALSAVVETKMFPNSMENENSSQSWIHGIGTDGERIIADPVFLIYTWAEKPEKAEKRLPAHVVSLSLSASFFWQKDGRKIVECGLWSGCGASDLEEYSGKFMAIFVRRTAKRKQIFEFFKGRNCSAQVLYQLLKQEKLPFNIEELESLFPLMIIPYGV